jgi:hypothetical protein
MDWLSVLLGGAITLVVSGLLYGLAARDLRRKSNELKEYTVMLINYLDDAGVIEVERDAKGNPVRVRVIRREVTDSVGISDSVQVRLMRGEEQQRQDENPSNS